MWRGLVADCGEGSEGLDKGAWVQVSWGRWELAEARYNAVLAGKKAKKTKQQVARIEE